MRFIIFFAVADPQAHADGLYEFCFGRGIKGTLLLAHEGINGTVAGLPDSMEAFCSHLRAWLGEDFEMKASYAESMPFRRLKVKVKPEIVTMGQADIDPAVHRGTYVDAKDWNALINDPDVIVVDTRNDMRWHWGVLLGRLTRTPLVFVNSPLGWRNRKPFGKHLGARLNWLCSALGGFAVRNPPLLPSALA